MSQKTMQLLDQSAPIFDMLRDENRRQIILQLFDHHELSVSELTASLELSRPAVSHHLKLMLDAGLVLYRKNGKERIYRLNLTPAYQLLEELLDSLKKDIETMS